VAAPLLPAVLVFGASFGVLARGAGFGFLPATVMSATTFAGSSQVAAVSVLGAGGGAVSAIAAALLLNVRYGPIGISVARAFRGGPLRRLVEAQLVVDESWALSGAGGPALERGVLLGIGLALWLCWTGGTAVGAFAGGAIGDPATFGLDGAFAALFLALLLGQLRGRRAAAAAVAGAAIAAALTPLVRPGLPIVAATAAVVAGMRRRAADE
jgi:4-azaleucine resistance transporter AzlC